MGALVEDVKGQMASYAFAVLAVLAALAQCILAAPPAVAKGPSLELMPDANKARCLKDCSGNGHCHEGECICYPNFQGPACAEPTRCKDHCNGNGLCFENVCR